MDYSLSTKWNINRHHSASDLVDEVLGLSLDCIEVGCDTPIGMLEGILSQVRGGRIRVSSLHNYCPAPTDRKPDGDSYLLSDTDPECRNLAIAKTMETMEWASRLGAGVVVLHLGRVDMEEATATLRVAHDRGDLDEGTLAETVRRQKRDREALFQPHFEAVCASLDALVPRARELGLVLGLENRLRWRQIPLPPEVAGLLRMYGGGALGYWHDMGHAEVMRRLGFLEPMEYFDAARSGIIVGTHIHDVKGLTDHLAPGTGDTDIGWMAPLIPSTAKRVLELSPRTAAGDIVKAIGLLDGMGFRNDGMGCGW